MAYQITNFNFAQAINFVCSLVGYPQSADPAGSVDLKHAQMRSAVTHACAELLTMREWQDLTKEGSISVVAADEDQDPTAFALPVDFYRFIDQTQYSPESMAPLYGGPASAQAWMRYTTAGYPPVSMFWQIREDRLQILQPPYPTAEEFRFFYISRAQILDEDGLTYKNTPSKNGDAFILDSYLIALLARKKWLEWNMLSSEAATTDFTTMFLSRAGADKGAPVLSLSRSPDMPLIGNIIGTAGIPGPQGAPGLDSVVPGPPGPSGPGTWS